MYVCMYVYIVHYEVLSTNASKFGRDFETLLVSILNSGDHNCCYYIVYIHLHHMIYIPHFK